MDILTVYILSWGTLSYGFGLFFSAESVCLLGNYRLCVFDVKN